jgi:hypothetical protein
MAKDWKKYQEEAAKFFRALGVNAETDVAVSGVRTTHDVDVLVKSHHAGFDVTWIVECKQWSSRVSKLHVLALREIVADVGADRGILLAESGFQGGAAEAASLTNVHITSLANLRNTASAEIYSMRLRELYDRLETCREQYWDIPKDQRITHGLRFDFGGLGYSGARIIEIVEDLLKKAFRGSYPVERPYPSELFAPQLPVQFNAVVELVSSIESLIDELEGRLRACIAAIRPTK